MGKADLEHLQARIEAGKEKEKREKLNSVSLFL